MVVAPPFAAHVLCLAALSLSACASGDAAAPVPLTLNTMVVDETLDVSFELPADWIVRRERGGLVFSRSTKPDEALATVTLQAVARAAHDLEAALLASRSKLEAEEGFAWDGRAIQPLGDQEALYFAERFLWNDVPRERRGVLFATPEALVELSYTAPVLAFAAELPVYDRALETLIAPVVAAP